MEKVTLLATLLLIFSSQYAQTLTIDNQTDCDIMFYSGNVIVGTTNYNFGTETDESAVVANTTGIYDISGIPVILPGYTGPPTGSPIFFVDFKLRLPGVTGPYTGSAYISATQPYSPSSPTPPGGCNNGNPYTVVWTGPPATPTIVILP